LSRLALLYELLGDVDKAVERCQLAAERVDGRLTKQHPLAQKIYAQLRELKEGKQREANAPILNEYHSTEMRPSGDPKAVELARFRSFEDPKRLRKHETF